MRVWKYGIFAEPKTMSHLHKSLKNGHATTPDEAAEKLLKIGSNDPTATYGKS